MLNGLGLACRSVLARFEFETLKLGHRQTLPVVRVRQVCVAGIVPTDPVAPRSEHRPLAGH